MSSQEIESKVRAGLRGTPFAPKELTRLDGGSVNWIYRARLLQPLDDGTDEVVVKHGELYMSTKPDFALNFIRCQVEAEMLKSLEKAHFPRNDEYGGAEKFKVRSPRLYQYIEGSSSTDQITEHLPDGMNLKSYVLRHYPHPSPLECEGECTALGAAIGRWLKDFHEWGKKQQELQQNIAEKGEFGQMVKRMINFQWMDDRTAEFPDQLGDHANLLSSVQDMAYKEWEAPETLQLIHGDFWTGNVLLSGSPAEKGTPRSLLVIDWELAQLGIPASDIGQMLAEMYALWRYKSAAAGLWLMEGMTQGYGDDTEASVFRTLIQMGAHLMCITTNTPDWGSRAQMEEVVAAGRDIILHAWTRDRAWFEAGELRSVFQNVA